MKMSDEIFRTNNFVGEKTDQNFDGGKHTHFTKPANFWSRFSKSLIFLKFNVATKEPASTNEQNRFFLAMKLFHIVAKSMLKCLKNFEKYMKIHYFDSFH